jgi:hypothetical protein
MLDRARLPLRQTDHNVHFEEGDANLYLMEPT